VDFKKALDDCASVSQGRWFEVNLERRVLHTMLHREFAEHVICQVIPGHLRVGVMQALELDGEPPLRQHHAGVWPRRSAIPLDQLGVTTGNAKP
jgi:hypothetical protein